MAQTRTPTPNSMVILDGDKADQTFNTRRPTSSGKKRVIRREGSNTSLEILPPEDKENDRHGLGKKKSSHSPPEGASSSSRPSSRSSRAPPIARPDSAGGRRPNTPGTPTRQVVLQAVRRKQDTDEDFGPLELEPNDFTVKKPSPVCQKSEKRERKVKSADRKARQNSASAKPGQSEVKHTEQDKKPKVDLGDLENSDQYDTDLDETSGSGSEEEEEEKPTAPTELMLEFLDCIYKKEWPIAKNLCRMILMYEPENEEANKFSALIEEKLQIVAERGSDEETGDEEDSDDDDSDSDDDTDGSDDEDQSSNDSSDADSEPEEEDQEDKMLKKDSGIGLSSSSGTTLN